MKYQWTDWITHVPGQELPLGMHGLFEFHGSRTKGGKPFQEYGTVSSKHKGHPCWYADNPDGRAVMILRYKLRSIAEENEVVFERELDLVE